MDLQKMIKLWPQYQSWLKENGVTMDNAVEKIPGLIGQLKSDPQKASQMNQVLNNPELAKFAKNFNVKDSDIQQMRTSVQEIQPSAIPTHQNFAGNLTQEQMDMIKKFKR